MTPPRPESTAVIAARRAGLTRRDLHTGWTVRATAGPVPSHILNETIPAEVPGVVHLDLLRAALIPDPYVDDNEALLNWIGQTDWTYQTTFTVDADHLAPGQRHELIFDGLDTVASISFDGEPLGEVANQHRTYRFDVTDRLAAGEHTLTVAFRSPVKYANAQSLLLGARPRPYPDPYEAIRKSACSFGWDWGIATATSGIWRAVRLETWSMARLSEVRVQAAPDAAGNGGTVTAEVEVEHARDAPSPLELIIEVAGVEARVVVDPGASRATATVKLPAVELWWPAGHGDQPLYAATITLAVPGEHEGIGEPLDSATRRVGFRTLEWDTAKDEHGTPFQLVLNGRKIFVKGVNWIPDDAFFPRVDRSRYFRRLTQTRDANLNLVRVWGGGMYESDDFYDACDELGLLVWQDFLFACAAYPEEEPLRSEVEAEARDNIVRMAHHASLCLLNGNNENLWGFEDWDWQRRLDGRTWGSEYYYKLLPRLVSELAPHVPYTPGSPFSPGGEHPNEEKHGTMHLWEQWNRQDYPTYRDQTPRFVAEFGWQGPPTWTTMTRSITDDPLTPESPGMQVHQKAAEGNVKLVTGLVTHYRVPDSMRDWHWAMQLNQANAVGVALEWFRGSAPITSGAVVWQINDCWPVTSWAAIDGDGREKPLYFALKNAFAARAVTVQPARGSSPKDALLVTVLSNDSGAPWVATVTLTRRGFDGAEIARHDAKVSVPAWGTLRVPVPADLAAAGNGDREVLVADVLDDAAGNNATGRTARGLWWFAEPRDSALPAAKLTAQVVPASADNDGTSAEVRVTAGTLVRDLTLLVDALDPAAAVDSGLVTLFPGESHTFRISGVDGAVLTPAAVLAPEVARSGNQLVSR